jgi:hypothetical protein
MLAPLAGTPVQALLPSCRRSLRRFRGHLRAASISAALVTQP